MLSGCAALLLAALAVQAPAQQAPAAAAQPDKAVALAELVAGAETTLAIELDFAKQAFDAMMATDADLKTLTAENPGLQAAVWSAVEPEIRRSSVEGGPAFVARIAAVYRSQLTPAELDGVYVFFSSATGQKLVKAMYGGVDPQPLIAEAVAGSEGVSASTLEQATNAGKAKAVSTIGPEDEPAFQMLARTVSLEKLRSVGEQVQKLTLEYVNEEDPALDARIEAAIERAFRDYFANQEKND